MERFKSGESYWFHDPINNELCHFEALVEDGFMFIYGIPYPILDEIVGKELDNELVILSLNPMVGVWASQYRRHEELISIEE